MKFRHLLLATAIALPVTANAAGWYAGPMLMTGITDEDNIRDTTGTAAGIFDNNDGNMIIGAAGLLGYDFADDGVPVSLELSTNWRARHDMDVGFVGGGVKSNVQTIDTMVSALYDIPLGTEIQPYIGGGVGVSWNETDSEDLDVLITDLGTKSTTNFAWQLQGGIKYPLAESMKLRVDYRYVDLGEVETNLAPGGEIIQADLYSHDVRMGVTFDF